MGIDPFSWALFAFTSFGLTGSTLAAATYIGGAALASAPVSTVMSAEAYLRLHQND